jgi:hypothetical protein
MEYNIRFTLDNELKEYFNAFNKYYLNSEYFDSTDEELKLIYKKRTDGIKQGDKLGDTGMHMLEIPGRKVVKTTKQDYTIKCPLCLNPQNDKTIYPYNLEKLLLWRGYLMKPNTFPYFKMHYLIQASDHIENTDRGTQNEFHKNPLVIEDMLEFIKIMNVGSILFNGWVGNSLGHFHVHYTDTHFPIKTQIKKYSFHKEKIKTKDKSTILIYKDTEHNCKNFIFIKGKHIKNDAFKIFQHLNSIGLFYNLLFYFNKGQHFMFIFIRQKGHDELNFNFGSTHMAGLSTFGDNNLKLYKDNKNNFLQIIENYCSNTLIKVDEKMISNLFSN